MSLRVVFGQKRASAATLHAAVAFQHVKLVVPDGHGYLARAEVELLAHHHHLKVDAVGGFDNHGLGVLGESVAQAGVPRAFVILEACGHNHVIGENRADAHLLEHRKSGFGVERHDFAIVDVREAFHVVGERADFHLVFQFAGGHIVTARTEGDDAVDAAREVTEECVAQQ